MIFSDLLTNVRRIVEDQGIRWNDTVIAEYLVEGVNEIKRTTGDTTDRIPFNFVKGQRIYAIDTVDDNGNREHGQVVAVNIQPRDSESLKCLQQVNFHELPVSDYEEPNTPIAATLLLVSNTVQGSTTFVDSTGNFSPLGLGAEHTTAQAKFGSSSIDTSVAANAYVFVASSSLLDIGANDFTFDSWQYFNSISDDILYSRGDAGLGSLSTALRAVDQNTIRFVYSTDGTATTNIDFTVPTIPLSEFVHIAIERYNGTLYLYINGDLSGSAAFTDTVSDVGASMTIGGQLSSGASADGSFDEFRFVQGTAVYGGESFNPPSESYDNGGVRTPALSETDTDDPTFYALSSADLGGALVDYQSIYFNVPAPRSTNGSPFGFFVDVKREFVFASDAVATAAQNATVIPVLPKFDRPLTNLVAGYLLTEVNDASLAQRGYNMLEIAKKYIADSAYVDSLSLYTYTPNRQFP